MPDGRFPAPPSYRTLHPGKRHVRTTLVAPAEGRHQANTSVAPITVTNGIGERVLTIDRSVRITAPIGPTT